MLKKGTKILAMAMCLSLLLSLWGGIAMVAANANLLTNGDFEKGTEGWTRSSLTGSLTETQFQKAVKEENGNHYICFDRSIVEGNNTLERPGVIQEFTLKKGTSYTLSYRYSATGGSNPIWCYLSAGNINFINGERQGTTGATWKTFTTTFKTPEDFDETASCKLYIYYNPQAAITSAVECTYAFSLDDITLTEVPQEPEVSLIDGNIIENGNFDNKKTDGWEGYNLPSGKTLADFIASDAEHDNYFCVTNATAGSNRVGMRYYLQNKLKANTTYILSFDSHIASTTKVRLWIQLNDANTQASTYKYPDIYLASWSANWRRVAFAFTTPEGFEPSTYPYILLYANETLGTTASIKIDNIKLRESNEYIGFGYDSDGYTIHSTTQGTLLSLGATVNPYADGNDQLNARFYSVSKKTPLVFHAVYEKVDDVRKLVYLSDTQVTAESYDANGLAKVDSPYKGLGTALERGKQYEAEVFAWDMTSGLAPIAVSDTFTFTY